MAWAQECEADLEDCESPENPPPLILPDLMPSAEMEEPLYAEAALYAPDGNQVIFQYLQDESIMNTVATVPVGDLQLPIPDEYAPATARGYFEGHRAWDVTYRTNPNEDGLVHIQTPHPEAILLASFDDVPLGQIAQRLQASGTIEVYYLNIEKDGLVLPYLITYAHLEPETVRAATVEAGENNGRVFTAGVMGDTGLTDGRHIHMQVIDLAYLYDAMGTMQPLEAYGNFANLETEVTEEMNALIFLDPSVFFPQLVSR